MISSNILAEQKWTLIGDVIGNNDNVSTGKSTFGGKEYDYVFNIDIGDGIPPLKLPFNNDQDPYTVAQVQFERIDSLQKLIILAGIVVRPDRSNFFIIFPEFHSRT